MERMIVIEPEKCTGCSICEMICSFKDNTFNPYKSKIKVLKIEESGIDLPIVCLHCEEPMCVDVCPMGAIKKDVDGTVRIDHDMCRGCKACMMVCPYGAIRDVDGEMIKCDLCDGNPKCAKWCPTEAIRFLNIASSEIPRSKRTVQFLIKSLKKGM